MNVMVRSSVAVLTLMSVFCANAESGDLQRVRRIDGVCCTLRADRRDFSYGQRPTLKVYVSQAGATNLWLASIVEQKCLLEVDGKAMRWTDCLWTDSMMQTAQSSWMAENGAYLRVTVDERMLTGLDGSKVSKLEPGEHTIVFCWAGYRSDPSHGSALRDKTLLLASNEVRVTVAKPAPNPPIRFDDRRSLVKDLFESYVQPAPLSEAEKKLGLKTELRSFHAWIPKFEWTDIDVLLDLAAGDKPAGRIPSMIFSSYAQRDCREGMIALWLIEGLRRKQVAADQRPGDAPALWYLPPLNPICTTEGVGVRDCETSAGIHREVLDRYRLWWRKVASMQPEDAAMYDPLAGTDLQWYGGRRMGKPLDD